VMPMRLFPHHPLSVPWIRGQIRQAKEAVDPGHWASPSWEKGRGSWVPQHLDGLLEKEMWGATAVTDCFTSICLIVLLNGKGTYYRHRRRVPTAANGSHRLISSLWVCFRIVRMPSAAFICWSSCHMISLPQTPKLTSNWPEKKKMETAEQRREASELYHYRIEGHFTMGH
jgi:hypothetical protein